VIHYSEKDIVKVAETLKSFEKRSRGDSIATQKVESFDKNQKATVKVSNEVSAPIFPNIFSMLVWKAPVVERMLHEGLVTRRW